MTVTRQGWDEYVAGSTGMPLVLVFGVALCRVVRGVRGGCIGFGMTSYDNPCVQSVFLYLLHLVLRTGRSSLLSVMPTLYFDFNAQYCKLITPLRNQFVYDRLMIRLERPTGHHSTLSSFILFSLCALGCICCFVTRDRECTLVRHVHCRRTRV